MDSVIKYWDRFLAPLKARNVTHGKSVETQSSRSGRSPLAVERDTLSFRMDRDFRHSSWAWKRMARSVIGRASRAKGDS
ncbi:hypothetical protein TNCV_3824201 [Trichonephila clavipes]|nr:hypothetical protein TNCV_3824201 [Trichonephila clavipes]